MLLIAGRARSAGNVFVEHLELLFIILCHIIDRLPPGVKHIICHELTIFGFNYYTFYAYNQLCVIVSS